MALSTLVRIPLIRYANFPGAHRIMPFSLVARLVIVASVIFLSTVEGPPFAYTPTGQDTASSLINLLYAIETLTTAGFHGCLHANGMSAFCSAQTEQAHFRIPDFQPSCK